MRKNRSTPWVLLLWLATLPLGGCYYLGSEPVPETSTYDLDLDHLRRLADSRPGPKPAEVRHLLVCDGAMPRAFMMAGAGWEDVRTTYGVFQLLRADGSYDVIDSAQDEQMNEESPLGADFFPEAWEELVRLLGGADQIVITHEHGDHIGGVAKHPRPEALIPRLRLSPAQLANEDALALVDFPPALAEGLAPLAFDGKGAVAVAPGVVVREAAGHTPGNQIVFVQLADGRELLFVGDVVWNRDAITELAYRPRFITDWLLGEDREAGLNQLRALRDLYDSDEGVHIVVAHDDRTHVHPAISEGVILP